MGRRIRNEINENINILVNMGLFVRMVDPNSVAISTASIVPS
jgi:hypothetical protein